MEEINRYFFEFNIRQTEQLSAMWLLYNEWNQRINVISRKDMENFYLHHVLHSLSIAKAVQFNRNTSILDVGTGGGFPGIPLAIAFPEAKFMLVDSIGKKIKVVQEVAKALGLHNVVARQCRAEDVPDRYDFIVSRAVTHLPGFVHWVDGKINPLHKNSIPNGILYLKGGDFEQELNQIPMKTQVYDLSEWFSEPFFETKRLAHLYYQ